MALQQSFLSDQNCGFMSRDVLSVYRFRQGYLYVHCINESVGLDHIIQMWFIKYSDLSKNKLYYLLQM